MRRVFIIIAGLFIWAYAQVDHYDFANISSPQNVDTPFQITITAKDAGGNLVDFTGKKQIYTNHGSNLIYMDSTKSTSEILFHHGTAQEPIEVRLATDDMRIIVGNDTSNSFVVNAGALNRVQILLPGEAATPGLYPGKNSQNIKSQKSGMTVDSVFVNATDKWWNVVLVSQTVGLSSSDSFAVLHNPHNLVNGTQMTNLTFRTVACPLPPAQIVYQKVIASAAGLLSDSSTVIVASGAYVKLLQILPGEHNVPGSPTGKDSTAVVTGYKQFNYPVYACDSAWNEAYPIPSHRITTWCNIGPGKYKTDTTLIHSGGSTLYVTLYPEPGAGDVHYSIRALDLDDATKNSYDTDITVHRVPDSLRVTAEKDTVALGIPMNITAHAFGGGQPYPNTAIHFKVLPVDGDGTLSDTSGVTSGEGELLVKFTGTKPGAVYVKAWSELDKAVKDSVRFVVITSERISFYPNPWSRSKTATATILYTLKDDVSSVSLLIADITGNIVKKVEYKEGDAQTMSGPHYVTWDGTNMKGEKVASGMYVIRVRATGEESFKRNALLLP